MAARVKIVCQQNDGKCGAPFVGWGQSFPPSKCWCNGCSKQTLLNDSCNGVGCVFFSHLSVSLCLLSRVSCAVRERGPYSRMHLLSGAQASLFPLNLWRQPRAQKQVNQTNRAMGKRERDTHTHTLFVYVKWHNILQR